MRILLWHNIVPGDDAFHAARHSRGPNHPTPEHGHDFAEVFWIGAGEGLHRINGQSIRIGAGDLIWIRPSDFHAIETLSDEPLVITNIAFPQGTMDHLGARYFPEGGRALWSTGEQPASYHLQPHQMRQADRWVEELARSPKEVFALDRFLLNLLHELYPPSPPGWADAAPEWLRAACREIQKPEHFAGGVPAFIRLTGYSREHAARCLKEFAGTTPTDLVNRARMGHAAYLLEMSEKSILEISFQCGMENLSHFYTVFRAHYGLTPRGYRMAHRRTL